MVYDVGGVDDGANPHVNYEPTSRGGPREATADYAFHEPYVAGPVQRKEIARANDYGQAGERYRAFEPWERDDLVKNLVGALRQCNPDIQERMVHHLTRCDSDYGARVAQGLGVRVPELATAGDD